MKTAFHIIKIFAIVYLFLCILLYFTQEKLIFFPQKSPVNYAFQFTQPFPFEELYFETADNTVLNGILFTPDSSRGLIFYLHGNAGSLASWGAIAKTYTELHYDVFMLDYRGYGKSDGSVRNETQFYRDVQLVYDSFLKKYTENDVTILGYLIGTGVATKLAATNQPGLLILQAPYFSLTDMMHHRFPFIPGFLLKYKFATNMLLKECTMPVVIFHGNKDNVIYYGSSLKLETLFKSGDTLITLENEGRNGMSNNSQYLLALQKILNR